MWSISRRLYLGDWKDAADGDLLSGIGITHVLNCAREVPCHHPTTFEYLHLPLDDPDSTFIDYIPELCEFIDEGRRAGAVLAHCRAGVSRSPAAVLAYLCSEGKTLEESLAKLQRAVGEADETFLAPDELFLEQIRDFFESE